MGDGMNRLSQMWDRLLPVLIYVDPMVAMAYYHSIAIEKTSTKAATAPRRGLVSDTLRGIAVLELVDAQRPAPVRR
jgi:hypothetical protein